MNADLPADFVDLVACLKAEGADFLIVGAHALAVHGLMRATGDLDILIRPDEDNAQHVFRALIAFGAPVAVHGISAQDFASPGTVYQLGLPPRRIDILTSITGVSFEEALVGAVQGRLGDQPAWCIGFEALLRNKRATGRAKDHADAEALEEIAARAGRG